MKDSEFRRNTHSSFKGTSRDQWSSSHSNKTMPPDVGKYTPKYEIVDTVKKVVIIREKHRHLGS